MKKQLLFFLFSLGMFCGSYLVGYKNGQIDHIESKQAIFNICEEECYQELSVRKVISHRFPAPYNYYLVKFITDCKNIGKEKPAKTLSAQLK
ncbi:hypothetical protein [Flexithrix dorotheae]|uniref:hypothetical protein n=1 Tax=Flexithrix dorotheae TaxID=70993 RepID=UPI0012FBEC9E|nr:hypothetical protein [Flexithrix dorotheae]